MQFMFSRKSGIVLAALLGVQLILPASGWALTGRDVALKADQVDTSRTSDMSMAMIIKRGDQQLVRFMAMKKKKFPDSEKQHIRFLEPARNPSIHCRSACCRRCGSSFCSAAHTDSPSEAAIPAHRSG